MELDCNDCSFCEVVRPEDDILPWEIVVEHGDDTGHSLSLTVLDGDD